MVVAMAVVATVAAAGGILVRRAVVAEAILVLRMSVALAWAPLGQAVLAYVAVMFVILAALTSVATKFVISAALALEHRATTRTPHRQRLQPSAGRFACQRDDQWVDRGIARLHAGIDLARAKSAEVGKR